MPESSRRTGISPRFMVSANSEEGATCLLRRARRKRMVPIMSKARTITPPITPPAMAPTLVFEVELVVKALDDAVDDTVAPAGGDVVGSAESWVSVDEIIGTAIEVSVEGVGEEESAVVVGEEEPEVMAVELEAVGVRCRVLTIFYCRVEDERLLAREVLSTKILHKRQ